ncbi:MAG TPA: hypothetical protein VLE91_02100 [Candidatus Saccharimonadales bacterium]|nr:hypothetical protein [Candidatus Saccharimonadales bacterium]
MIQHPQILGSKLAQLKINKVLNNLPQDVLEYTMENITFMASFKNAWAYTLEENDIKGKYVIVLSDELLNQGMQTIAYTITHEIGHAISGHRNAIRNTQTKAEIKNQEKEAHNFARKVIYV